MMGDESLKYQAQFQKERAEVDLAENIDFIYAVTCMSKCIVTFQVELREAKPRGCSV